MLPVNWPTNNRDYFVLFYTTTFQDLFPEKGFAMSVIPATRLVSDDLAILTGCRRKPRITEEDGPEFKLATPERADAFSFGPVPLSQIIRHADARSHSEV